MEIWFLAPLHVEVFWGKRLNTKLLPMGGEHLAIAALMPLVCECMSERMYEKHYKLLRFPTTTVQESPPSLIIRRSSVISKFNTAP
uniref:Uncharacterized protein n=1 Tax=Amphiprion percula TaxID=161767 RepID=A0A3P8SB51_AMPPE